MIISNYQLFIAWGSSAELVSIHVSVAQSVFGHPRCYRSLLHTYVSDWCNVSGKLGTNIIMGVEGQFGDCFPCRAYKLLKFSPSLPLYHTVSPTAIARSTCRCHCVRSCVHINILIMLRMCSVCVSECVCVHEFCVLFAEEILSISSHICSVLCVCVHVCV